MTGQQATATPVEALIEMPLSLSLAFEDANDAGEQATLDEIRAAAADGYRAAVEHIKRAAMHSVPAIRRTHPLPRHEHGAITVHITRHDYGDERVNVFPFLHAHLVIDPTPVTGEPGDTVSGKALADTVPPAQVFAVHTASDQLKQDGYAITKLPIRSPHGFELSAYAADAVQQTEGGRGFSCPRVQRGSRQHYPVDFNDPGARADRAAGRI